MQEDKKATQEEISIVAQLLGGEDTGQTGDFAQQLLVLQEKIEELDRCLAESLAVGRNNQSLQDRNKQKWVVLISISLLSGALFVSVAAETYLGSSKYYNTTRSILDMSLKGVVVIALVMGGSPAAVSGKKIGEFIGIYLSKDR